MAMEESEFSRRKIIKALEELNTALEGQSLDDLSPEVADKVRPLRNNVRSLLERLRQEREERD
ncbi:hypothetical protein J7J84_08540 [bacterium]|nr:hypothetical protein [bacterium]